MLNNEDDYTKLPTSFFFDRIIDDETIVIKLDGVSGFTKDKILFPLKNAIHGIGYVIEVVECPATIEIKEIIKTEKIDGNVFQTLKIGEINRYDMRATHYGDGRNFMLSDMKKGDVLVIAINTYAGD